MRKHWRLAGAIVVVALAGTGLTAAGVVVLRGGGSSVRAPEQLPEGTSRTAIRRPPDSPGSCEAAAKAMQLDPATVKCPTEVARPPGEPTPGPIDHGRYRLVPGDWEGSLTYIDIPDTHPAGVVTSDVAELRNSSLFAEPKWLPPGYAFDSATTNDSDSEHVIDLVYTGPGKPIHVSRVRRFSWPLDLLMPSGQRYMVFSTFEEIELDGLDGIMYYPSSAATLGSKDTVLSVASGDVETTVHGEDLDPPVAISIAASVFCGAKCATNPPVSRQLVSFTAGAPAP